MESPIPSKERIAELITALIEKDMEREDAFAELRLVIHHADTTQLDPLIEHNRDIANDLLYLAATRGLLTPKQIDGLVAQDRDSASAVIYAAFESGFIPDEGQVDQWRAQGTKGAKRAAAIADKKLQGPNATPVQLAQHRANLETDIAKTPIIAALRADGGKGLNDG